VSARAGKVGCLLVAQPKQRKFQDTRVNGPSDCVDLGPSEAVGAVVRTTCEYDGTVELMLFKKLLRASVRPTIAYDKT
jgi:hypothetical protein